MNTAIPLSRVKLLIMIWDSALNDPSEAVMFRSRFVTLYNAAISGSKK